MTATVDHLPTKIVHLDPQAIAEHPLNPRSSLGDLSGLAASIRELGVQEPLTVVPRDDGTHMVIFGHRRRAAAVDAEAPTVPCILRADLAGDTASQLLAQATENLHREGFTPSEEAVAFHQLAAFSDWTPGEIAEKTAMPLERVRRGIAVGGSEPARTAAQHHGLTLEQAAALIEFENDPDSLQALLEAAEQSPGRFDHELARLHRDRDYQAERDRLIEEHTAADVTLIDDEPRSWDDPALDVPRKIVDLADADGNPLDPDDHTNCPGHAVSIIDTWNKPRAVVMCIDPQANGHSHRHANTARVARINEGPPKAEVIANNRAWRAAEEVRRRHIATVLTGKKIPKGTMTFLAREILATPKSVGYATPELLAQLTGNAVPGPDDPPIGQVIVNSAGERTMPLVLLAQLVAAREKRMPVDTWRYHHGDAARWLEFLQESTGYELSDIEQRVIDTATKNAEADVDESELLDEADGVDRDAPGVVELPPGLATATRSTAGDEPTLEPSGAA